MIIGPAGGYVQCFASSNSAVDSRSGGMQSFALYVSLGICIDINSEWNRGNPDFKARIYAVRQGDLRSLIHLTEEKV